MAAKLFQKLDAFSKAVAEKKHNLGADSLKVMLVLTAPVQATSAVKADLTEIAAGNGYTAGGNAAALTSSTQTAGVYKLVLADPATWTAAGGAIANFRYAVLYNDTATNKDLIGFWDYGATVTVNDGETFRVDFDPITGVLTLT
jgi:hypothetical protein